MLTSVAETCAYTYRLALGFQFDIQEKAVNQTISTQSNQIVCFSTSKE